MSEIQFHIIMVQDVITSDIIIYNTMSLFVFRASPPLRVGRYRTQHSKTHGIILLNHLCNWFHWIINGSLFEPMSPMASLVPLDHQWIVIVINESRLSVVANGAIGRRWNHWLLLAILIVISPLNGNNGDHHW